MPISQQLEVITWGEIKTLLFNVTEERLHKTASQCQHYPKDLVKLTNFIVEWQRAEPKSGCTHYLTHSNPAFERTLCCCAFAATAR